jgi:aspartyl aminopeptidase
MKIVATHTDSPALKLSPIAKMTKSGYLQPAIQTYGGGIWHTWFDRDLGLAGKVIIRNPTTKALEYKLIHFNEALLRIPNLAIHFTRKDDKFEFNKEQQLRPFLATQEIDDIVKPEPLATLEMKTREFPAIIEKIASELKVDPVNIVDFDLNLIDAQPAGFMGIYKEFISSGKIDNQISCHCGLEAFKDLHESPDFLKTDKNINILVMFDHEEIGSKSMQGALSTYLAAVSKRIFQRAVNSPDAEELYNAALRRSFILSTDLAHAINPNYAGYHQEAHPVHLHKGVVIKTNYNISYATDSVSSVILKELAKKLDIPVQEFVVKCDSLCGTTVGPLVNTNTCIKTVDIGIGQLAMHSIRETCATTDVLYYYQLIKGFYEIYHKIDTTLLGV